MQSPLSWLERAKQITADLKVAADSAEVPAVTIDGRYKKLRAPNMDAATATMLNA